MFTIDKVLYSIGVSIAAGFIIFSVNNSLTKSTEQNVCVKSKEITVQHKQGKYLVFTNKEVFEISDSYIYGRFDSSDVYNQIETNKCYDVELQGNRIPFFSMYRNIIGFKEVR